LIAVDFVMFVLERRPPAITAFCGAVGALMPGLVDVEDVLAAIANAAPAILRVMSVQAPRSCAPGALEAFTVRLSSLACLDLRSRSSLGGRRYAIRPARFIAERRDGAPKPGDFMAPPRSGRRGGSNR